MASSIQPHVYRQVGIFMNYHSYFPKKHIVGTQKNHLNDCSIEMVFVSTHTIYALADDEMVLLSTHNNEMILVSTHNICLDDGDMVFLSTHNICFC